MVLQEAWIFTRSILLFFDPKLAAIAPAAPFAHYDQLVAQALSTTDSVFAKKRKRE